MQDSESRPLIDGVRWGQWQFDASALTLEFTDGQYYIPLDEINDNAQMLDWIFQLHLKTWATPQIMYDLLCALQDIFRPEANLCSFGESHTIHAKTFLPRVM